MRIDGQTISSSSYGYIIIPRLTQGSYKSYIGFPKTELPELAVNFIISDADAGYLVKNDLDQGLYMIDLKTKKFVATERKWPTVKKRNVIKSTDDFSRILSEVVNDSSINEIDIYSIPVQTTANAEISKPVTNAVTQQSQSVIEDVPEIKVDNKMPISKPGQKNSEGLVTVQQKKNKALVVAKKENEAGKTVKFTNIGLQNPSQPKDSGIIKKDDFVITQKKNKQPPGSDVKLKDDTAVIKANLTPANTKCKKTATEIDFANLHKKMVAEKKEAGMRLVAGKQFRNACFTTEQIQNLGVLFITEEERYEFYVSAYPYVSDAENFVTLEGQLTDSYYITRFKAMLNH